VQWWQVLTLICLTSAVAACAGTYFGRVFTSSLERKQLLELQREVAELTSEYARVLSLTKKISQRLALEDHRYKRTAATAKQQGEPPPPGDKAAAKAYYLTGRSHIDIAKMAQGAGQ
jgi:hypothetical protein